MPTLGGILADEMGLGKTLMALALVVEAKRMVQRQPRQCGTLIVVPKSVIAQWAREIRLHVQPSALHVYSYYEAKERKGMIDLCEFDVVLTTYAVLGMDYADKFGSVKEQSQKQRDVTGLFLDQKQVEELLRRDEQNDDRFTTLAVYPYQARFRHKRAQTTEQRKASKGKAQKGKLKPRRVRRSDQLNLFEWEFYA